MNQQSDDLTLFQLAQKAHALGLTDPGIEGFVRDELSSTPELIPLAVDHLRRTLCNEPSAGLSPESPRIQGQLPESFGSYRRGELIGYGGFGVVYKAEKVGSPGLPFAVKILYATATPQAIERLSREVQVMDTCRHVDGVVKTVASGQTPHGHLYYVMECVENGRHLQDFLEKENPSYEARIQLFVRLAGAVADVHNFGIAHGDISPRNVLVQDRATHKQPLLCDFGGSHLVSEELRKSTGAHTRDYVCPERDSLASATAECDVFALGRLLERLLKGDRVPRDLQRICDRALKPAGGRYPSAVELKQDLDLFLNKRPLARSTHARSWHYVSRLYIWRNAVFAISFLIIALTTAVAFRIVLLQRDEARASRVLAESNRAAAETAQRKAEDAALRANSLAAVAQATALARTAEDVVKESPELAMLLGLEAYRLGGGKAPLAESFLRATVNLFPYRKVLRGHEGSVQDAVFSPDSKIVVTAGTDSTARVWDASTGAELRVLHGHTGSVWTARFSPDGRKILTLGSDMTARLWDANRGKQLYVFGSKEKIVAVQFSPDGRRAVTATDHMLEVWDVVTGMRLLTLSNPTDSVVAVNFSADGSAIIAAGSSTARVWDSATGQQIRSFRTVASNILERPASFSPKDTTLLTGDEFGHIHLWDWQAGKELRLLRGGDDAIPEDSSQPIFARPGQEITQWDEFVFNHRDRAIEVVEPSSNGRMVLGFRKDRTFDIWDILTGKLLHTFRGHEQTAFGNTGLPQFFPDDRFVLTSTSDNTARIWNVETGESVYVLRGHNGTNFNGLKARFSPDGMSIVTASEDGTARLWDIASLTPSCSLKIRHRGAGAILFEGGLIRAQFTPDGRYFIAAGADAAVHLIEAKSCNEVRTFPRRAWFVEPSPNGNTILMADLGDTTVEVYEVRTGNIRTILRGHQKGVNTARFSKDGRTVLTASDDKTARLWDAATGKQLLVFAGHRDAVVDSQFSLDGRNIVTASTDGTVKMWDISNGKEVRNLVENKSAVTSLGLSPDGKSAAGNADGTLRIWSLMTESTVTLSGFRSSVARLEFSPDGKTLLTAASDQTIQIWNAATGEMSVTLRGHGTKFFTVAPGVRFSPDGRTILTNGQDGTARLWDAVTGKELRAFPHDDIDSGDSASFSPDGRMVLTVGRDNTVRLWNCVECRPIGEIIEVIQQRVSRGLTASERRRFGLADGNAEIVK